MSFCNPLSVNHGQKKPHVFLALNSPAVGVSVTCSQPSQVSTWLPLTSKECTHTSLLKFAEECRRAVFHVEFNWHFRGVKSRLPEWVSEGELAQAGARPPYRVCPSTLDRSEMPSLQGYHSSASPATPCPVPLAPLVPVAAATQVPTRCPVHGLGSPALPPRASSACTCS